VAAPIQGRVVPLCKPGDEPSTNYVGGIVGIP
jgi:hypothetical protein